MVEEEFAAQVRNMKRNGFSSSPQQKLLAMALLKNQQVTVFKLKKSQAAGSLSRPPIMRVPVRFRHHEASSTLRSRLIVSYCFI
jgi:hypothetical protein